MEEAQGAASLRWLRWCGVMLVKWVQWSNQWHDRRQVSCWVHTCINTRIDTRIHRNIRTRAYTCAYLGYMHHITRAYGTRKWGGFIFFMHFTRKRRKTSTDKRNRGANRKDFVLSSLKFCIQQRGQGYALCMEGARKYKNGFRFQVIPNKYEHHSGRSKIVRTGYSISSSQGSTTQH